MKKNLWLIAGAVGLYYLYTSGALASLTGSSAASGTMTCQYPDGTSVQVNSGASCPFDSTHGGQSVMCYPSSFVGPLPPGGGGYCQ